MTAEEQFDRRMALVEEAIRDHGSYLLNYIYSFTNQWQDAEDIHTALFVYVLNNTPEDKINHLGTLLVKARFLCIDHYRKKQRNLETPMAELPEIASKNLTHIPDDPELQHRFFTKYDVDLTEDQKNALWLYGYHGYTLKEVAEQMGKPTSTIGDWIAKVRKLIAELINQKAS